jgi:multidrug efflux pump
MEEKQITNKMGIEPVGSLILKMGIPMILSMMLQAFYNIVDSYFVSSMEGVGDAAVNALTLTFPIQALMVALAIGTGVGVNSLLSKFLGMGDRKTASRIAGNAVFLSVCTYILFLIFGLFFVDAYISSQTSDPIIQEMGCSYLKICTVLSFGSVIYMIYEKLLQGTGKTVLSTIAQVSGAITNIILDPIMIFGMFGCPALGIAGAAYATVIGQVVSLVLGMIFHHTKNKEIETKAEYLVPDKEIITAIYRVGIPAIIMQALMSVMTYCVNIIFVRVSGSVVTAYGIYFKIQQFVFFAAFGLNNAIIPIVAFNYGMRDRARISKAIRCGLLYNAIIMLAGAVLLQVFGKQIIGIFDVSTEVKELSIQSVRIVTLGYIFVGANVIFQGIFQALGEGIKSLVISAIRLIIVVLPLAYFFTTLPNAQNIVWAAFPIAEACGLVVSILFMSRVSKNKLSRI